MSRPMRFDDLTDILQPSGPTLSADGSQIVYVVQSADVEADRNVNQLWQVGTASGVPRQLTRGTSDTAPAFSPAGNRLAFLRGPDGAPQVWVMPSEGGEPEQCTTLPLGAGEPIWSPDGSRIAFVSPVDIEQGDDGESKNPADEHAPIVSDRLDYKSDGTGMLRGRRSHVHVLDLAAGEVQQVTGGDWHAGAPAWSPDGQSLAFGATTGDDPDLVTRAPLHVVDLSDAKRAPIVDPAVVALPNGVVQGVTWAADGQSVFVVGTAGAPAGHAHLIRVPLGGGKPIDLSGELDRNVMVGGPAYPGALPVLTDDGETVLFCARDAGCTRLFAVAVAGGDVRLVLGGDAEVVSGLSVAGGTAAVALATADSFGEIVVLDVETGSRSTRTNHGATLSEVSLFPRRERRFTISDGTVVSGWLMTDPAQSGARPLLLDVHGGPHNAWNGAADSVHGYHQVLVARGWAVLLVNPRGSDGYGEAFYSGVTGAWGEADANDFLEPLDELVAEGLADPARLAVAGYSYGGFMTCYLTSRDDRFAAAVTGGVVADLVSLTGTCDGAPFFTDIELAARPWDDPELYARLSPFTKVGAVRTPTLVVHGVDDTTCPIGQAQQWHTALRLRKVPTRLVLYPGAGHLFIFAGPPSQRLDWNRRIVDWVEQYAADPGGPRRPRVDATDWEKVLREACDRHGVMGAELGILRIGPDADGSRDEVVVAAAGLLNQDTGQRATPDSLFQIGSITKVWTTTVAMQLVDEGLITLETPIVDILPDLRLSSPEVTKSVTLFHLLTHTSGIDGDLFTDTGRGDDCLAKFVDLLAEAGQNHPLGATWSYCNSGFSLAGRVIEKLTGQSWDEAMRERLFTPLGLTRTVTLPEEAILHRAAVGHQSEADGPLTPTRVWGLTRSTGPAGVINSTASEVLSFARMHLNDGVGRDATRILSSASVAAMADRQVGLPDQHTLGDSWGLGWIRFDWDGHRLIGHDGSTLGQNAMLKMLPEAGLAVTLLTNGGDSRALSEDLYRRIFPELAGVKMPASLTPPDEPVEVDVTPHLGVYERASVRIEVLDGSDGPRLHTTVTGPLAELLADPTMEYDLVPVEENLFAVRAPGSELWSTVTFYQLESGERYLHFGARATPLVGAS